MSGTPQQQGQKDAAQGKGPHNTHGWNHIAANGYNANFSGAKK